MSSHHLAGLREKKTNKQSKNNKEKEEDDGKTTRQYVIRQFVSN